MTDLPTIAHIDMDAFFAAVEQRDKPSLRGRPVVVAGLGPRGVVATASYEARRFGVGSAMPTATARRLCPQAVYLSPRFAAYEAVSRQLLSLFAELSPQVEPVSLDEAFLDLTVVFGTHPPTSDDVGDVLTSLRRAIKETTGLPSSAGAGTSKLIAKLASDAAKPDGQLVIAPGTELAFLHPLPVSALWGVGPVTGQRLGTLGVHTVAELHQLNRADLVGLLGVSRGANLYELARAVDPRPVQSARERKSVGAEMTFDKDITTRELVEQRLAAVARETASRLAAHGAQGRTITLKVRFADFSTVTRASSRTAATADPDQIYQAVRRLLAKLPLADGVRLLGVTVSALSNTFQDPLPGLAPPAPTPIPPLPMAPPGTLVYREGSDVVHAVFGPGWAQSEQGPWTKVQFTTPPYARRGPLLVPTSSLTRPVSAELTTDPNPAR